MLTVIFILVATVEAGVIVWQHREMARRNIIVEDFAELALDLSLKSNLSYDAAFQSLMTLTYTAPDRIRKR